MRQAETTPTDPRQAPPGPVLAGWISRADLARELGLSEDTLRRWEGRRIGPACVRAGRRVYYRRAAVEDWLTAQETTRQAGRRARR